MRTYQLRCDCGFEVRATKAVRCRDCGERIEPQGEMTMM